MCVSIYTCVYEGVPMAARRENWTPYSRVPGAVKCSNSVPVIELGSSAPVTIFLQCV